ncbi:helix-turn-helix transcriptional regulator [Thermoactinomyces sp. CICC 10522]|uniref:helix-turn-helix domain-containing protein n=1 Tax=Thermoactinomyces sp. CICC 10522 TaxID=2767427 RepID=UPI0018DD4523|nr:helix-turn-helix transcriptional regulator [Thermoactinomyces sp. CICC 10522]MBH8603670.1 helix-turn-helix transcriptional regulator [Thermoactinomyces sp. CICC 10522]
MYRKPTIRLTKRDLDVLCSLKGITRRELAKQLGYSESYLSHARRNEIPFRMSQKICMQLGIDDDFVLELRELQRLYDSITGNSDTTISD